MCDFSTTKPGRVNAEHPHGSAVPPREDGHSRAAGVRKVLRVRTGVRLGCLPSRVFISGLCLHTNLSPRGGVCCSCTHCYLQGCGPSSEANAAWLSSPAGPVARDLRRPRLHGAGAAGALLLLSIPPALSLAQPQSPFYHASRWHWKMQQLLKGGEGRETWEEQSREEGGMAVSERRNTDPIWTCLGSPHNFS